MRSTKIKPKALTHERLLEVLDYCPESGTFFWRYPRKGVHRLSAGGVHKQTGYVRLTIDKDLMLAHRVAWFYVTGKWPEEVIDHINGDRADNRFSNLRQASIAENLQNRVESFVSTSGHKNVIWYKAYQMWQVQVAAFGKRYNGGYFKHIEDAVEAAKALRNRVHKAFACHS